MSPILTHIIEESGPLIDGGRLGESGLGDQFVGLVIKVVVEVVPQQQVQQRRLALVVITQGTGTQSRVQETKNVIESRYDTDQFDMTSSTKMSNLANRLTSEVLNSR